MGKNVLNLTDPAQNFIERYPQALDSLFYPKKIAVIGAKDDLGSVGRTIMMNLLAGPFKKSIYPINPKRNVVMGVKSYPSLAEVNEEIDLAIIVTPAKTVPGLVRECVQYLVKSIIIISAGFKEAGDEGIRYEKEISEAIAGHHIPIIGPNCLGIMNPVTGLNATFAKGIALPGNLAFISQSGAMCTSVLDWSLRENVGFSSFVSLGSMIDVNWGTLIDYLGQDPQTQSLLLYMETVGDAKAFITAARQVALEKPIIVIKAGRSVAAANAAASHTGSLAGSDDVFDAALERIGVLRVDSIAELFNMASVLSKQPLPKGPNLSIVTNAGGPAVLATDSTVLNGAELTPLSNELIDELNHCLPSAWSHSNPIDILGDANAERYEKCLEILGKDAKTDGVLVILSPQDMTEPALTAEKIALWSKRFNKTLLTSWMGGESVAEGAKTLSTANIPVFEYPDQAAAIFAKMWGYQQHLKLLYETPSLVWKADREEQPSVSSSRLNEMKAIIEGVQLDGRDLLTEYESKQVLQQYGIPVVKTEIAKDTQEALKIALNMGFPVVLKLHSKTITHKSDVGGVKLNLKNEADVLKAFNEIKFAVESVYGAEQFSGVTVQPMISIRGYELILGSLTDSQFGPVLLFGTGGELVEVFKDRNLALPPLTANLAKQLIRNTKIYEALKGVRGRPAVDLEKLEQLLIRFSLLVAENPRISECDINPLVVSENQMIALDARIVLHDASISDEMLPKLSIRPYPSEYIKSIVLKNGESVVLRPICPEDEPLIVQFHRELSEDSVRQRYFEFMTLDERVAHERLIHICFNDYDREWAIVAEIKKEKSKRVIAIGRLSRIPHTAIAQIKMTIVDAFHGIGLGSQLLQHLLSIAKKEKIAFVDVYILSENTGMLKICENEGFVQKGEPKASIINLRKKIK